jgi:hypothetical protein
VGPRITPNTQKSNTLCRLSPVSFLLLDIFLPPSFCLIQIRFRLIGDGCEWKPDALISAVSIALLLLASTGCETFSGMSEEERVQSHRDMAQEEHFWPGLKPSRSLASTVWAP